MVLRLRSAFSAFKSVPNHKPPFVSDSPAGRYASALFSSASKKEALDLVQQDLHKIQGILKESSDIRNFLYNSSIKKNTKLQALSELKSDLHEISWNFLTTLAEAGKFNELPKAIDNYNEFFKVLSKQESVRVISHKQLKDDQKTKVVEALQKSSQGTVKVQYQVDPTIMGGLQIFRGSTFLDCSLRSRIERIRTELSRQ